MLCPKCNKKMKVLAYLGSTLKSNGIRYTETIGRCNDCDFDATWTIATEVKTGKTKEGKLKQYFFG